MNLLERYTQHIERLRAKGAVLTKYACPACAAVLEALTPPNAEVWDSMATCPHCEAVYWVVITTGKVETTPVSPAKESKNGC